MGRLQTMDKIHAWSLVEDTMCVLCGQDQERTSIFQM
jgi:hypothetical protein